MRKADLRAEKRIPDGRRATLLGANSFIPCMIENISESGFSIGCDVRRTVDCTSATVGEILELRCEMYTQSCFHFKVEIRHITNKKFGVRIVEFVDTNGCFTPVLY
jgi:hypothetical protein